MNTLRDDQNAIDAALDTLRAAGMSFEVVERCGESCSWCAVELSRAA